MTVLLINYCPLRVNIAPDFKSKLHLDFLDAKQDGTFSHFTLSVFSAKCYLYRVLIARHITECLVFFSAMTAVQHAWLAYLYTFSSLLVTVGHLLDICWPMTVVLRECVR